MEWSIHLKACSSRVRSLDDSDDAAFYKKFVEQHIVRVFGQSMVLCTACMPIGSMNPVMTFKTVWSSLGFCLVGDKEYLLGWIHAFGGYDPCSVVWFLACLVFSLFLYSSLHLKYSDHPFFEWKNLGGSKCRMSTAS